MLRIACVVVLFTALASGSVVRRHSKIFKLTPYSPVGECPYPQGSDPVYLPDSESCEIYYECSNGVPVKNYCTAGLQWNTAIDNCDRPENVNCQIGGSRRQPKTVQPRESVGECPYPQGPTPVYLPDSENCQIYYECSQGEPVQNHCADDLQWNTVLNTCDRPENVNCQNGGSRKRKTVQPRKPVGECPYPQGSNPVFLPDSENCQIYYECSQGEPVQNHCADDLQWNTVLNTCDRPENVNCQNGGSRKRKTIQPRKPVGDCPVPSGSLPVYLPDSDSCSLFYECDAAGNACVKECPAGTEFNPVKHVCDSPLTSGCTAGNKIPKPFAAVGDCPPKDGQVPVYLPDDKDCGNFYECSNGIPWKLTCAPGDLFDSVQLKCVESSVAHCYSSSS